MLEACRHHSMILRRSSGISSRHRPRWAGCLHGGRARWFAAAGLGKRSHLAGGLSRRRAPCQSRLLSGKNAPLQVDRAAARQAMSKSPKWRGGPAPAVSPRPGGAGRALNVADLLPRARPAANLDAFLAKSPAAPTRNPRRKGFPVRPRARGTPRAYRRLRRAKRIDMPWKAFV